MKKVLIVVGTRPNFIKITQFPRVLGSHADKFDFKIIHTGQHFDDVMSKVFFQQFGFLPDVFLKADAAPHGNPITGIRMGLEKIFAEHKPDLVMVVGDVNSTAAGALAAKKLNIKVAHVESGLRSFDQSMPEELNRILTDNITDYFFVTEQSGIDNLIREGKDPKRIFFVGNTMIDTMVAFGSEIDALNVLEKLNIHANKYVLITMHRPATVDSPEGLNKLINVIDSIAGKYKIVFPIHPRTVKNLKEFGLFEKISDIKNLILSEPLDYFSFQKLIKNSRLIITDSGGIQEESTFLGVPCLTLRPNTERPVTVELGTNELLPFDLNVIKGRILAINQGKFKKGSIPPLWDGHATERIMEIISRLLA